MRVVWNSLAGAALAFLASTALLATSADAEPSDPSPSADFAGVWRIVGAQPAPWVRPHALSKAEAPLLEFAISFDAGEVKGPPGLECKAARYGDTISYPVELFDGRLPKGREDAVAKSLRLQLPEIGTIKVACANGRFSYFTSYDGDRIVAVGDVIYTLSRPQGMDTDHLTAGYSGPSFDCTKAKTAGDKLLCSDTRLATADRKLGSAYAHLRQTETADSFATVKAAERGWLAYVIHLCGAAKPLPESAGDQNPIRDCLDENYSDRADRLDSVKAVHAGSLILEPRMRFLSRTRPSTEESDIWPWMGGGAAATPFNTFIAKTLRLDARRMDDKNLFAFGADQLPDTMSLYARRTYSVDRFDTRIVSLQVSTYDFTGGAHEVQGEHAINWDLARHTPVTFDDLFAPGSKWQEFVTDYCVKNLKGQFEEGASAPDRAAVRSVATDIGNWMLQRDAAVVHFTVYTVASFSGGEYDVKIPWRVLKKLLKPGAPAG